MTLAISHRTMATTHEQLAALHQAKLSTGPGAS